MQWLDCNEEESIRRKYAYVTIAIVHSKDCDDKNTIKTNFKASENFIRKNCIKTYDAVDLAKLLLSRVYTSLQVRSQRTSDFYIVILFLDCYAKSLHK